MALYSTNFWRYERVMSQITKSEVEAICQTELPLVAILGAQVETIGEGEASVRLPFKRDLIRPGGTVSGPAMMAIADYAFFIGVLSLIGAEAMAVTTNLNCNFLRRPGPKDLLAKSSVLKLGKRLAYGEVTIYSEGETEPVAHATCTYSIPAAR